MTFKKIILVTLATTLSLAPIRLKSDLFFYFSISISPKGDDFKHFERVREKYFLICTLFNIPS